MGLDISVWQNIKPISTQRPEDERDVVYVHVIDDAFAANIATLQPNTYYSGRQVYRFHAGSYGGYNDFREALGTLTGVDEDAFWGDLERYRDKTPFFRLLCFADNEGCIDAATARMLHKDFVEHRSTLYEQLDDYDQGRYDEWTEATRLASEPDSLIEFS